MILPFNDDTSHKLLISKVYMFKYINKVFLKSYFLLSPQGYRGFPLKLTFFCYESNIIEVPFKIINGLQEKGVGVFDREFTKSLIIRDFDDVLKNPCRYVHLFLLHTLLSKKFPKIAIQDL